VTDWGDRFSYWGVIKKKADLPERADRQNAGGKNPSSKGEAGTRGENQDDMYVSGKSKTKGG